MLIDASPTRTEARKKAALSRIESADLEERTLYCPECGFKVGSVFSDCTGHLTIRCRKCKQASVLNLAYFRRQQAKPEKMFPKYLFAVGDRFKSCDRGNHRAMG